MRQTRMIPNLSQHSMAPNPSMTLAHQPGNLMTTLTINPLIVKSHCIRVTMTVMRSMVLGGVSVGVGTEVEVVTERGVVTMEIGRSMRGIQEEVATEITREKVIFKVIIGNKVISGVQRNTRVNQEEVFTGGEILTMGGMMIIGETPQSRTTTEVAALGVISDIDEVEISVGKVSTRNMAMVLAETLKVGGFETISPSVAWAPQAAWNLGLETLMTALITIVCGVIPLKVRGIVKLKGQGTLTLGTLRVTWTEGLPMRKRVSIVESTEGDHLGRGKTWVVVVVVVDGKCKVSGHVNTAVRYSCSV